ncbi:MAG: hypothetical protein HZB87_00285 [Desulfatitalea sp.]|nr:hypothetical protein [Desulfatitalea sp.]
MNFGISRFNPSKGGGMRTGFLSWLVALMFLAACQSAPNRTQPDENSPHFLVPTGTTLVLHQPLQVPAWQDQVYFQDGKTMSWRGVNIYLPYCTLKLAAKKDAEQGIRPDRFVVTKSYTELFFMQVRAPMPPGGITLAAAGWLPTTQIDFETRDGMDYKVVAAVMELRSDDQPEVLCMLCTDWGLPPERAHITIKKIRRALGAAMTLQLAPPPDKN